MVKVERPSEWELVVPQEITVPLIEQSVQDREEVFNAVRSQYADSLYATKVVYIALPYTARSD